MCLMSIHFYVVRHALSLVAIVAFAAPILKGVRGLFLGGNGCILLRVSRLFALEVVIPHVYVR